MISLIYIYITGVYGISPTCHLAHFTWSFFHLHPKNWGCTFKYIKLDHNLWYIYMHNPANNMNLSLDINRHFMEHAGKELNESHINLKQNVIYIYIYIYIISYISVVLSVGSIQGLYSANGWNTCCNLWQHIMTDESFCFLCGKANNCYHPS